MLLYVINLLGVGNNKVAKILSITVGVILQVLLRQATNNWLAV